MDDHSRVGKLPVRVRPRAASLRRRGRVPLGRRNRHPPDPVLGLHHTQTAPGEGSQRDGMEPPRSSKQIGAGRQGGAIELIYGETNVEEPLRVSVVRDLSHPAIVLARDVRNKAAGRVDAREPDGRDGDEQYGLSKRGERNPFGGGVG